MTDAAFPFAFEFRRRVIYPVVGLIIVAFSLAVGLLYQVSQSQDLGPGPIRTLCARSP